MNEKELEEIRRKMRGMNIQQILVGHTKVLRMVLDMTPPEVCTEIRKAITTSLEAQKKEYELFPFKNIPSEWADLMSSENHEQFLSVCKDIEQGLGLA